MNAWPATLDHTGQTRIPIVRDTIETINAGDVVYLDGAARLVIHSSYEVEHEHEALGGGVTRRYTTFEGWLLWVLDEAAPFGDRLAHIVDEDRIAVRHLAVEHTAALPDDWCAECHLVADAAHRDICPPF